MSELISKDNHLSCCVFMQWCCRFLALDLMKSKITSSPLVKVYRRWMCHWNFSLKSLKKDVIFRIKLAVYSRSLFRKKSKLWNRLLHFYEQNTTFFFVKINTVWICVTRKRERASLIWSPAHLLSKLSVCEGKPIRRGAKTAHFKRYCTKAQHNLNNELRKGNWRRHLKLRITGTNK